MLISNPPGYWSTGGRLDQDAVVEYGNDQLGALSFIMVAGAAVLGYFYPPVTHNLTTSCASSGSFSSTSSKCGPHNTICTTLTSCMTADTNGTLRPTTLQNKPQISTDLNYLIIATPLQTRYATSTSRSSTSSLGRPPSASFVVYREVRRTQGRTK